MTSFMQIWLKLSKSFYFIKFAIYFYDKNQALYWLIDILMELRIIDTYAMKKLS